MRAPADPAIETFLVHQGRQPEPISGAVAASPVLSTTFARREDGALMGRHLYARYSNPTRAALEQVLARLEGADAARCTASGSAAAHLLLQTLDAGDRLVVDRDGYFGVRRLMHDTHGRRGVEIVESDFRDLASLDAALQDGADLVWCESPTNPLMRVLDLEAVARRAHQAGAALLVDNTLATPILQRPIELGADFVLHSSTKYFGGHSDVLGGALIAKSADHPMWQRATQLLIDGGAVAAPFDCWLIARSLATLALRVNAQSATAANLASMLAQHPAVEAVRYPGLPSHPDHALAMRQMAAGGAMLSFHVRGGEQAAARVAARLELFTRATSLGAVHSLVEHRCRVEGPNGITPVNLLRLSVGIENGRDLDNDLRQALATTTSAGEDTP